MGEPMMTWDNLPDDLPYIPLACIICGQPVPPSQPEHLYHVNESPIQWRRHGLTFRIETLRGLGALELLAKKWPDGVATFKNSETHTALELDQINEAICFVEAKVGAPFGPADPHSTYVKPTKE